MFNLNLLMQGLGLVFNIFTEVHNVQTQLPGAPGADKSAAVINKIVPYAEVFQAEVPHIQSMIDGIVAFSKLFKVGSWADPVAVGAVPTGAPTPVAQAAPAMQNTTAQDTLSGGA